MFEDPPKPVEDGYEFTLEQDSLANAMGARLPNRSLWMIQGEVGSGKSLISQRLIFGLLENGSKILVVTTELTTRGWIEQMESIGYPVTDYIASGKLMVFSRFGVIAESRRSRLVRCARIGCSHEGRCCGSRFSISTTSRGPRKLLNT